MRPTHNQSITISDDTRANVSVIPAVIVSIILVMVLDFRPIGDEIYLVGRVQISLYLVAWPTFALVYLLWTHAALQELDSTELIVHSKWATRRRRSWMRFFGSGGAVSWSMLAAIAAIVLNLVLVTAGSEENLIVTVLLGLANVVASWAVMVYSFALEYMRLDLAGGGSEQARQLEFEMGESREFGDYLTFSVLSSTMTAALPGRAVTRTGWRLVRTNVIVAFAFNSVVVATLVSMILSYVTA